jgi:hypothetical protein
MRVDRRQTHHQALGHLFIGQPLYTKQSRIEMGRLLPCTSARRATVEGAQLVSWAPRSSKDLSKRCDPRKWACEQHDVLAIWFRYILRLSLSGSIAHPERKG